MFSPRIPSELHAHYFLFLRTCHVAPFPLPLTQALQQVNGVHGEPFAIREVLSLETETSSPTKFIFPNKKLNSIKVHLLLNKSQLRTFNKFKVVPGHWDIVDRCTRSAASGLHKSDCRSMLNKDDFPTLVHPKMKMSPSQLEKRNYWLCDVMHRYNFNNSNKQMRSKINNWTKYISVLTFPVPLIKNSWNEVFHSVSRLCTN